MSAVSYISQDCCYLWQPILLGLHGIADGLIAIAYLSIFLMGVYLIRQRQDFPFTSLFWLLSLSIVCCGITHGLAVWMLWHPNFWLVGILKAITMGISFCTSVTLASIMPQAVALLSPTHWQTLNRILKKDIAKCQQTEAFLQRYEHIVSATQDAICLVNCQMEYQIVNNTYLEWHQTTFDRIIGHHVSEVVGREVFERELKPYLNRCLAGESIQFEVWINYPKLGKQFISVGYAPFIEADGKVSGAIVALRNLTKLKQVEADLRRYERIVSATSDGISLVDRNYIYQIVNETYLQYYNQKSREGVEGHSVKELLGETVFTTLVKPKLDACLAGETILYEAWFDLTAMGQQFLRVTYSPYREADGTISGIVASTTNLTSLKQVEKALRESELKFRGIFDQMYQFIGLLSPDGTLLEANRAALEFGGMRREEVLNQPFWEVSWWKISTTTQEQLKQAIARAAQGEFIRYEVDVQGARGQVITIDFSLRPVFDESGKVVLLIPEGRDITERRKTKKQLELQAVITRNMAEGICLVRVDNAAIVYANPKFERMFGYDSGELKGKHVSIVNYATEELSAEDVNQAIRSVVLANQEATYEVYNVKKDGTPFWCSATTSVFHHPDYGKVLVAVHQDISDRKEAQEKLQKSLQEKELLLKEIYHRVKNNLQVIHSLLNLQSRNLSNSEALSVLRDSQSRIRAMALVHEKLYQSPDLTHIDLADYVKSLTYSLLETYRSASKDISIRLDITSCSLDVETALPCGLILTELISNSLKYAFPKGRGGEIAIASTLAQTDRVTLTIRDNGIGLPPNFDLNTVSSLGLSLVNNLIQQIKGEITISDRDIGTEFQLSFPQ